MYVRKGQPHKDTPEHIEYVIYDKRRALIDYIAFYIPPRRTRTLKKQEASTSVNTGAEQSTALTPATEASRAAVTSAPSSGSCSPLSGRNTPQSGRSSPVDSDEYSSAPETIPKPSIPRVTVTRNRSNRPTSNTEPSVSIQPTAASAAASGQPIAAATSISSSQSTVPTHLQQNASAPHMLALRSLASSYYYCCLKLEAHSSLNVAVK
jgi:hypothetical protein